MSAYVLLNLLSKLRKMNLLNVLRKRQNARLQCEATIQVN